jgi:hypothetical protein
VTGRDRDRRDPGGGESTLPLESDLLGLALFLAGPGVEVETALTGRATWTIGRARDNDIVVDHPSVSRYHARLHTGDAFALEALAATNPLRLGSRTLGPGERATVAPGEAFALGALVGVIRPVSQPSPPLAIAAVPAPGNGHLDAPVAPAAPPPPRALRDVLADEERRRIVDALRRSGGNQSRAAELLGMPRRTLVKRLREYGIPRGRVIPDADS